MKIDRLPKQFFFKPGFTSDDYEYKVIVNGDKYSVYKINDLMTPIQTEKSSNLIELFNKGPDDSALFPWWYEAIRAAYLKETFHDEMQEIINEV